MQDRLPRPTLRQYSTVIAALLLLPCGHQTPPTTISGELRVWATTHIHPFSAARIRLPPSIHKLTEMDQRSLHRCDTASSLADSHVWRGTIGCCQDSHVTAVWLQISKGLCSAFCLKTSCPKHPKNADFLSSRRSRHRTLKLW